jgi:hypothetical protein
MCSLTSAMIEGLKKGRKDRFDDHLLCGTHFETTVKSVVLNLKLQQIPWQVGIFPLLSFNTDPFLTDHTTLKVKPCSGCMSLCLAKKAEN